MNAFVLTLTYAGAMAVVMTLTPLTIRLARRLGIIDLPHARKVHADPTPRLGGAAIGLATLIAVAPILLFFFIGQSIGPEPRQVLTLLVAAGFVLAVGMADDVWRVPAKYKLLALVAAAAAVCGSGLVIHDVTMYHRPLAHLGYGSWPVTMLWLVGAAVALNFMDGLDGLSAGVGVITTAVLAIVLALHGSVLSSALTLALLGSLTGFLYFNFNPARVFMGDGGAMFMGFLIAGIALLTYQHAGTMQGLIVPAMVLSVPILDTAATLIRRKIIQRRSLFAPERGHIHHRLMDLGLTHRQSVMVIYGVTLAAAGIAMIAVLDDGWATVGGVTLLTPLLVGLFRGSGSVRVRQTLSAIRHNRKFSKVLAHDRDAFEEMELGFRVADNFAAWWDQVRQSGQALGFASIQFAVENRDGSRSTFRWESASRLASETSEQFTATVPIQHRRAGEPLRAKLALPADPCMESAGRRVTLFARLMQQYSLAGLPETNGSLSPTPPDPDNPIDGEVNHCVNGTADDDRKPVTSEDIRRLNMQRKEEKAVKAMHQTLGPQAKVALVHDFLYTYAGAERVLEQMVRLFPDADIFSLFDFLPDDQRGFIKNKQAHTSLIQRLPLAKRKHRAYLPLMPLAIEQLDVSEYDLVISSSYVAAKGVITRPDQLHVCYCHTPVRFAWDLQHQYLGTSKYGIGPKSILARCILHYIRNWDARSANGVDRFISNSSFVAKRIKKFYRRDSMVIYPPVDIDQFTPGPEKENFYVTASRLVQYKRIDLIVEAFALKPDKRLIVVGDGPDLEKLKEKATPNVRFVGYQPTPRLRKYMQMGKAFIFAAEEDFGIVPVEAQACGTPVIAFNRGGATESVIEGQTGVFFCEQSAQSIADAIDRFEQFDPDTWNPHTIRANAERFSPRHFRRNLATVLTEAWGTFHGTPETQTVDGQAVKAFARYAPEKIEKKSSPSVPDERAHHDLEQELADTDSGPGYAGTRSEGTQD